MDKGWIGVGSGADPRVVRRLRREVESSDAMVASDISGDAVVDDDSRGCLSKRAVGKHKKQIPREKNYRFSW